MPVLMVTTLTVLHFYLRRRYLPLLTRIFQEKPLFIISRGQPRPGAEDITFPTTHALTLRGGDLKTPAGHVPPVIVFGLQFRANRPACVPDSHHVLVPG